MATVNFSVPDEVKEAFNKAFAQQNKSAVIADLMRDALPEMGPLRFPRRPCGQLCFIHAISMSNVQ